MREVTTRKKAHTKPSDQYLQKQRSYISADENHGRKAQRSPRIWQLIEREIQQNPF